MNNLSENKFDKVLSQLSNLNKQELVILTSNELELHSSHKEIEEIFQSLNTDILFSASADFPYEGSGFNLFYWKYYPRESGVYHYLNAQQVIGTSEKLVVYLEELSHFYGVDSLENGLKGKQLEVDVFQRHYIESIFGQLETSIKVKIDSEQLLFGLTSGRESVVKWPFFNSRQGFIFSQMERQALPGMSVKLRPWDLKTKDKKYYNYETKQYPAITLKEVPIDSIGLSEMFISLKSYFKSVVAILKIGFYNGGHRKSHEIFRFRKNQNKEIKENIEKIIDHLKSGTAFSFSHFNDGEITFIKKYLAQDHKEVWFGSYFGRIQDKYNKALGELLVSAFEKKAKHYYIGTPCPRCHPKLSEYAKEIRPVDDYTIPAMTFHHNLSRYPEILGQIKKKKVYFVVNPKQDLTFFKKMGFEFSDEQVIRVPFRNSHEEYEKLKKLAFDEGAVVLMMCGMLAKILCAYWFENFPKTTFIAFGSSFDDYIQSSINFNLYPEAFPFSKSIIGSRSYLFGYKKQCPHCFDFSTPFSPVEP